MPVTQLSTAPSTKQRRLEDWLETYIDYTRYTESPTAFHFWTGVSTIAGALRRRVWIDQHYFQWTPNFYIVLVAPAGISTKSTSIRLGTRLLQEVPGVHFGPNSLTWQSLAGALSDASESVPLTHGARPQDDPAYFEMSAITCHVGELGTFLRPDDKKLVDVLTDLWDGQLSQWQHDTKTQGKTTITNPWLNILAATTPAWLKDNMPEAMIGGGLTSRIVFVFADRKRHLIAYPADITPPEEQSQMLEDLTHDLRLIGEMVGEYQLTREAKDWGVAWYESHWKERPKHMASDRFGGYIARKQTHIHKLAMVVAAARRAELTVTLADLKTAESITTALEADMLNVFQSIGVAASSALLLEILSFLRVHKSMRSDDLWECCWHMMDTKQFNEALDAGIKAGFITAAARNSYQFYEITPKGKQVGKSPKL